VKRVISESVNSESVVTLGYARRFQDLGVYKKARALAREVFVASKGFPAEEKFSLTDQLRRASRSIGAQIAEAWAKRRYEKHFVSKLTDADGEQLETQHWLTSAFDCGYLTRDETQRLGELCLDVGRMLGEMMAKADQFCQPEGGKLREGAIDYKSEGSVATLTDY
jgi:four helix bundle protein